MPLAGGRFEIVRALGRGGMGEVLLARQTNLGRLVVIKRLLSDHSPRHARALLDEARVAARLHHPSIVSVLDVGTSEDVFVAMEYVAGVTLREMLECIDGGLPLAVAFEIAIDVLRGLEYAHGVKNGEAVGIVHRDVKPRNVMVAFTGDTKLIDFGISRWLTGDGAWEATSVSGTFGYMAPEQEKGARVDGRADQYALAVTLREMLTGKSPRDRDEATVDERSRSATRPLEFELAAILERATARNPEERFADCGHFIAALEDYAKRHDIVCAAHEVERWMHDHLAARIAAWEGDAERASVSSVRITGPTAITPPIVEADKPTVTTHRPPPTPEPPAPRRRWCGRWPWFAAAAAVAVGAILAIAMTRGRGPRAPDVIAFAPANLGAADDAWLGPALDHLARRALRDVAARPCWLSRDDLPATRTIELDYARTAAGIRVTAVVDPPITVEAGSVIEAADKLIPVVARAIGDAPAGPDASERAQMTRIGATSFDAFRKLRRLGEDVRVPGFLDTEVLAAQYEDLARADPAWAHAYLDLYWLRGGPNTPGGQRVLDVADARIDKQRDPIGAAVLSARRSNTAGKWSETEKLLAPYFKQDPADFWVGDPLNFAQDKQNRTVEANAIYGQLDEAHPDLYYTGDLATQLEQEGREGEAAKLIETQTAANPDNLTGMRERVRLEAQRGDLDAAKHDAHRMLLVHGHRLLALAELFDTMILADELAEAQRVVDQMVLGSPVTRARGHYRSGVLAVFEGRFGAATEDVKRAAIEFAPIGEQGEAPESYALLRGLARYAPAAPALLRDATQHLVDWYAAEKEPDDLLTSKYELALLDGKCPDVDKLLAGVVGEARETAQRNFARAGAAAGCSTCKDVVARGFASLESNTEALVAFGVCARSEHELGLARRAFEQATRLSSSWMSTSASPYHAILARFHLAGTLEELGDRAGAKREYERFLKYWGSPDRTVPEVTAAQAALAKL